MPAPPIRAWAVLLVGAPAVGLAGVTGGEWRVGATTRAHTKIRSVPVGYVAVMRREPKVEKIDEAFVGRSASFLLASLTRHNDGRQLTSAA